MRNAKDEETENPQRQEVRQTRDALSIVRRASPFRLVENPTHQARAQEEKINARHDFTRASIHLRYYFVMCIVAQKMLGLLKPGC